MNKKIYRDIFYHLLIVLVQSLWSRPSLPPIISLPVIAVIAVIPIASELSWSPQVIDHGGTSTLGILKVNDHYLRYQQSLWLPPISIVTNNNQSMLLSTPWMICYDHLRYRSSLPAISREHIPDISYYYRWSNVVTTFRAAATKWM